LLGEQLRRGGADPGAAAGDEGDFAVELHTLTSVLRVACCGRPEGAARRRVPSAREDAAQWTWHKFVWREAGAEAYRRLLGTILAPPVWEVRYATFDGDVVERAEEWRVTIADDRSVRALAHTLPEQRAGAKLARDAAQALAERALQMRFGVDAKTVDHIRLSAEHGFGTLDVSKIDITGDVSLDEAKARA
jgi:hypothetical protein